MASKKRRTIKDRWLDGEVTVEQWFERDRAFVGIQDVETTDYLAEWWDDEVHDMIEGGFFKAGRMPFSGVDKQSVIDYADYIGISSGAVANPGHSRRYGSIGTSLREFIRENRQEIDAAILRGCPNCRLNNREREMWIRNDEGLYHWARSEGVRI